MFSDLKQVVNNEEGLKQEVDENNHRMSELEQMILDMKEKGR